jgi:hypothetical protein
MSAFENVFDNPSVLIRNALVTLLIPLFLESTGNNPQYARLAAQELLTSCGARSPMEWLFTALSFAFGTAALVAITQPIPEDVSPSLALRIRANANALNRSAERCRVVVEQSVARPRPRQLDPQEEEALLAETARVVAMTSGRTAPQPAPNPPQAKPAPASIAARSVTAQPIIAQPTAPQRTAPQRTPAAARPAGPASMMQPPVPPMLALPSRAVSPAEDAAYKAAWASAMADVAQEMSAELDSLPPDQRYEATLKIRSLTETAQELHDGARAIRGQISHEQANLAQIRADAESTTAGD